jgi:peptide/nickel transport system substrate-binding protein
MIGEVQPGATISLVRNPAYYGPRPGLERLVFRVVPDVNAQVSQLRAGALDLITVEPANLANLDQVAGIRVSQVPVVQHWYVGFNNADPRFASPLVRRALDLAVDRAALISGILRGYGDAPGGTIPVALRDYFDSTAAPLPYAPDSARALLTRAGWRPGPDGKLKDASGRSLAFSLLVDKGNPTREQSALAVQQHLADLGVTVAIQTMEFAALVRDKVLPGDFEAVLIWWTTPPDPDQYAFYGRGQDNNHVRWDNARGDSLLAAGRATLDPVRRRALYEEFQRVEREDPPVLVLFYPREIQAMSARLAGLPALGIRDALRYSERLHVTP